MQPRDVLDAQLDNVREISIPWSVVGGRPASFSWLGYVVTAGGFIYAQLPATNPVGSAGATPAFKHYFNVSSSNPGAAPFADERSVP